MKAAILVMPKTKPYCDGVAPEKTIFQFYFVQIIVYFFNKISKKGYLKTIFW